MTIKKKLAIFTSALLMGGAILPIISTISSCSSNKEFPDYDIDNVRAQYSIAEERAVELHLVNFNDTKAKLN
jgi:hypothetical protein